VQPQKMRFIYKRLRLPLLIGVHGVVPCYQVSGILLGDVIISGTVVQYDFARQHQDNLSQKDTTKGYVGLARGVRTLLSMLQTDRGANWLGQWTA
jgi:hypothetical protein